MTPYQPNFGRVLLANLGSFWVDVYQDSGELQSFIDGLLRRHEQTLLDTATNIAALSRFSVPLFKRELWYPLELPQSQITQVLTQPAAYDDGHVFDGTLAFDQPARGQSYRIALPAGLTDVQQITNNPINPTVIWIKGVDFTVNAVAGTIDFPVNPFQASFITRASFDGGVEQLITTLWCFAADFDLKQAYRQFGYAVELYAAASSDNYRRLLNAVFDALIKGGSLGCLRTAIAAIAGVPLVQEQTETVQAITNDTLRLQVITDKHVYDYPPTALAAVRARDVVYAGDSLITGLVVLAGSELVSPANPLAGLALDPELTGMGLTGPLVFLNQPLATSYTLVNGFADVRFPVYGAPADLLTFWNHAVSAGRATGYSVAQALRLDGGQGVPAPAAIPAMVNPMQFLLGQQMGLGAVLVILDMIQLPAPLEARGLSLLRRLLPAHTALLIATQLTAGPEYNQSFAELPVTPLHYPDPNPSASFSGTASSSDTTAGIPQLYLV